MGLMRRLEWLVRKERLAREIEGFGASFWSYASKDVFFSEYVRLYGATSVIDATIGKYSYLSGSIGARLNIGSFCSVGPGTRLGGMGQHPLDMISTHPVFFSKRGQCGTSFAETDYFEETTRTSIGHDVWIGADVILMDGITVGDGAVIGAGAVVTKHVPPYAVVWGVPAMVRKFRFSDAEISTLQELRWWTFPDEIIKKNAPLFRRGCVRQLVDAFHPANSPTGTIPQ